MINKCHYFNTVSLLLYVFNGAQVRPRGFLKSGLELKNICTRFLHSICPKRGLHVDKQGLSWRHVSFQTFCFENLTCVDRWVIMLHQWLQVYLHNRNTIMLHASPSPILQTFQTLCTDPMAQITCILWLPLAHIPSREDHLTLSIFYNRIIWLVANISRLPCKVIYPPLVIAGKCVTRSKLKINRRQKEPDRC